jgi:hypothetical protein
MLLEPVHLSCTALKMVAHSDGVMLLSRTLVSVRITYKAYPKGYVPLFDQS